MSKFRGPLYSLKAHSEWGQLSDNEWKQECERTAFPFLLRELRHQFPRLRLCIHLDALYATDPNFILLKDKILAKGYTISFVMKQMILDLIYLSNTTLFEGKDPIQLCFGKDPPQNNVCINL
ncbi:MAG: hypothetical protein P4L16_00610 [Chlamydiales bacterium]|nr:hypothetical protein [Chlamydiales bacterium]